jgi:DNA-binding NarL/FixJ family response regulator
MMPQTSIQPMQIILAEPHSLVRRGLMQLLTEGFDPCTVHEVRDAQGLFDEISRMPPDLLVVDISLPGGPGMDILKDLHDRVGDAVPLIVTSDNPGPEFTRNVLLAGAHAVVLKERADEELLDAIEEVRKGCVHH